MNDEKKTKVELIEELVELRERMGEWEVVGKRQQVLSRVREEVWKMKDPKDMDDVLVAIRKGLDVLGIPFETCDVNIIDPSHPSSLRYHKMEPQEEWLEGADRGVQIIHHIWQERNIAYRPDLEEEDSYGERSRLESVFGHAVRAVIDIPFSHGTLAVNSSEANAFSEPHIRDLQALAEVLSEGFQRLEDIQKLEQKNRELEVEINERQQTEEALRESEKRYRSLLESISDSVYVLDREFRHVVVNDAAERFVQIPKEKLLGGKLTDLFPEVEETGFFKVFQQVMESRNPDVVTDEYIFVDGRKGWYEVHVYPVPEGILCISRDITERKQAEEALRESETNYREIFDNATDMVFIQDTETGAILDVNATTLEKTGYTYEELINMGVEGFSPKGNLYSKERITQIIEKVVQGKPQLYEWGYIDKAGEFHPTEVSLRLADIGEKNTFLELHATSPNASRQRRC